jgi:molecular chaperone DnaK
MARNKIDYGIDLGTTNSAIARMENGESVIKQTKNNMDTLPSCVYFSKNKKGEKAQRVGIKAKDAVYSDAITALSKNEPPEEYGYLEFKREMGSDKKYHNDNMPKVSYSPEELSAEVLKELKGLIIDENVNSVVITVPAMFTAIQKDATMKAAKMAGFKQCVLLQEPIAACMAYGLSSEKADGKWLVFDFGGGTFDAALVKVEDGILTVYDTEGDNYLGGKNLDEAMVNKIFLPSLASDYDLSSYEEIEWKKQALIDALKGPAEEMRIALSFAETTDYSTYDRNLNLGKDDNGEEIDLEITVTRKQLAEAIRNQYQKAVDICKELLKRNGLSGDDLSSLILVGGPTYSPIIRDMLRSNVTPNVDTSINPMTAVARGAALYASTIDADINEDEIKKCAQSDIVFLQLGYESTSVEPSEWVSININSAKTGISCPSELYVELQRADGAWRSDKTPVDSNGNVIEAYLLEGKPNTFQINAYDNQGNRIETFPSDFTIIQGVKVGAAPLPYNIGIAVYSEVKKRGVFMTAKGLEKNKPLPAVGVIPDRRTTQALRPGVSSDILSIPVYQVSGLEAEGKTAALNTQISSVEVTGDDVEQLIPENSEVEITLHVDSSEMMMMEVYFPTVDFTIKKELDLSKRESAEDAINWVKKELKSAQFSIKSLSAAGISVEDLNKDLESVKDLVENGNDPMRTQSNLKELLRKIEALDDSTEWQRIESKLREEFDQLEKAQDELGNEKSAQEVNQLRTQTDEVIRTKNVQIGREVLKQVHNLFFRLTFIYQCMNVINYCNKNFANIRWKDSSRARQLVNYGLSQIKNNPTTEDLRQTTVALLDLMHRDDAKNAGGLLK